MRVLPTSHSDELDVEIGSPEAIMELEGGNFSRFYGVLDDYLEPKPLPVDFQYDHDIAVLQKCKERPGDAHGDGKKETSRKDSDFKRINLIFPDEVLENWETHSKLDEIRDKFREYCAIERKHEEKTAENLNRVKDALIFGGTVLVTYGLGGLVYLGYISMLKETPLLISVAADVVLAAGFGVRHGEMAHRDKVGKMEMVDDAELNFVTRDEYNALLDGRKNNREHDAHDGRKETKAPEVTRTIEVDCCNFFENEKFSTDGLIDAYRALYPEKRESMRKRLSGYVNEKILKKTGAVPEHQEEEHLRLIVYAKEGCEMATGLQDKFRTHCRNERMKTEKNANLAELIKDVVTFAGPVVTTYGLGLAVYKGLLEVANHMPLIIDTAADGVLASGLVPRKVETRYREKAKLLEKLENAEIELGVRPLGGASCPRKGFYSQMSAQA